MADNQLGQSEGEPAGGTFRKCSGQALRNAVMEPLIGVERAAELLDVSPGFIRDAVRRELQHPGTGARCYRLGAHNRLWKFRYSELIEDLCHMRKVGRPRKMKAGAASI